MNEQVIQKLKILTESAKYDVSCASSGTSRKNTRGGVGNTVEDGASVIAFQKTDAAFPCSKLC